MTTSQKIGFRLRSSRIGTKIAVPFSLLIALIAAFVYFYLAPRWEEQKLEAFESKVRTIANIAAYTLSPALVFEDSVGIHESLLSVQQEKDVVFLAVYNASGKMLDGHNVQAMDTLHPNSTLPGSHIINDGAIFCFSTPIRDRDVEIGQLTLGLSLKDVQDEIFATQQAFAATSILILLVGLIAVVMINRAVAKPLAE
ncbi:MAG: hypothetical protein MN733_42200, partial [Nitrososphaera sp.]|nr:hypothetical protein [Nitrososphaera sp.]